MGTHAMEWINSLGSSDDWLATKPIIPILLSLQLLDIIMGILASFSKKRISSTIGWKGFTRKIATLVIVCMVAIIDPLIPFPLAAGAALAYSGWEGVSIVEKAGMLGVPIPPIILDALQKLRDSEDVKTVKVKPSDESIPVTVETFHDTHADVVESSGD